MQGGADNFIHQEELFFFPQPDLTILYQYGKHESGNDLMIQVFNKKGCIFFTLLKKNISNPVCIQSGDDDGGHEHDDKRGKSKKLNQPERLDAL